MSPDLPKELDLAAEAASFANEVQELVRATLDRDAQFEVKALDERFVVQPIAEDGHFIPLRAAGTSVGSMRLLFRCTRDHEGAYLAVEKSGFELLWDGARTPLLRLEYNRGLDGNVPSCHWHVHAERGAFSALLAATGAKNPHALEDLHLPVGGGRMRPCVEDFIEFLIDQCGVDPLNGWRKAIEDGREVWRLRQIGVLVRDAPERAAEVLRRLGYEVTAPKIAPTPNKRALRRS